MKNIEEINFFNKTLFGVDDNFDDGSLEFEKFFYFVHEQKK